MICGISIPDRDQALNLLNGNTTPRLEYQRTPNPRKYQIVRTHTKETTWIQNLASSNYQQLPVQDGSSKQKTRKKYKPNYQQRGLPTHSALVIRRGKKNPQLNLTLYKAYTNHWTKFRRTETKRKKEFNLEAWEKGTSNTIRFFKNNEKAEKYCKIEGTN